MSWTWSERGLTIAANAMAFAVCLILLGLALFVIGSGVETIGQYNADHDRCLKQATNGYEIERCR